MQQKDASEILAIAIKSDEAFKKNDAAPIAALHTQGAVQVWDWSWWYGFRSASHREGHAVEFASSPGEFVDKLVQVYADPSGFSRLSALTRKHLEKKLFSPPFKIQIPKLDEEIMNTENRCLV